MTDLAKMIEEAATRAEEQLETLLAVKGKNYTVCAGCLAKSLQIIHMVVLLAANLKSHCDDPMTDQVVSIITGLVAENDAVLIEALGLMGERDAVVKDAERLYKGMVIVAGGK